MESTVLEYEKTGIDPRADRHRACRASPRRTSTSSSDGKWVVIAANHDTLWRRLAKLMGKEELGEDERFSSHHARGENEDLLDEIIGEWAGRHTAEELDRIVNEAGVVCAPVYSAADIYDDPYFRERDLLVSYEDEVHGTVSAPGVVPKLSGTPGSVRQAARWTVGRRHGRRARRAGHRRGAAGALREAASSGASTTSEEGAPQWPTAWEWTWEGRSPTCSSSTTTAPASGA